MASLWGRILYHCCQNGSGINYIIILLKSRLKLSKNRHILVTFYRIKEKCSLFSEPNILFIQIYYTVSATKHPRI